eukprot:5969023-Karenia_brevis.AAC.1
MQSQRNPGSVFDIPIFSGNKGYVNAFTWNTRALLNSNGVKKKRKASTLWSSVHKNTFGLLQEVHGDQSSIDQHFARLSATHIVHSSPGTTKDKGGVVTLLQKDYLDCSGTASMQV